MQCSQILLSIKLVDQILIVDKFTIPIPLKQWQLLHCLVGQLG